jgi:hypothetical protein
MIDLRPTESKASLESQEIIAGIGNAFSKFIEQINDRWRFSAHAEIVL